MEFGDLKTIKAAVLASPQHINTPVSPHVYYRIRRGDTPLQMAIYRFHGAERISLIEFLIAQGADVNARELSGHTPLVLASGDSDLSDLLIRNGAQFDIFTAVTLERLDQIELRLKENPELVNATLASGETPLFRAGTLKTAEMLLVHGANVNHRDRTDRTPLWNAANREIAELFAAYGADIEARSCMHLTTPLNAAAIAGKADVVAFLLEQNADPYASASKHHGPLHKVANTHVAALLLKYGVDVNARSERGDTALFSASYDTACFLITKGADVNARDRYGRTALHGFAQTTDTARARLLIAHGANVRSMDRDGLTPLHLAYHTTFAELLLASGADINARDARGRTPLHYKKNVDAIEFLVRKRADINARDNSGETPLTALKYHEEQATAVRQLGGME